MVNGRHPLEKRASAWRPFLLTSNPVVLMCLNGHSYLILHVDDIERKTCRVCCLHVFSFLCEVLVLAGTANWLYQSYQHLLYNLFDLHSNLSMSPHFLIFLSQFFFLQFSFTLSASPLLVGDRQSAPGRWGVGGVVVREEESGEAAGNNRTPRGEMKRVR